MIQTFDIATEIYDFWKSGASKKATEVSFYPWNILTSGFNMQQQMMGSFNVSFYKLGDRILTLMQDSKSRTSFYYHMPSVRNYERGTHFINHGGLESIDNREANTYQTYFFYN